MRERKNRLSSFIPPFGSFLTFNDNSMEPVCLVLFCLGFY